MKKGDVLFKIVPTLYQARLDAELTEVQIARIELENTRKLFEQKKAAQAGGGSVRGQVRSGHRPRRNSRRPN